MNHWPIEPVQQRQHEPVLNNCWRVLQRLQSIHWLNWHSFRACRIHTDTMRRSCETCSQESIHWTMKWTGTWIRFNSDPTIIERAHHNSFILFNEFDILEKNSIYLKYKCVPLNKMERKQIIKQKQWIYKYSSHTHTNTEQKCNKFYWKTNSFV